MQTDREAIAAAITAGAIRVPALPERYAFAAVERAYVVARVAELIAIWRENGVEPEMGFVLCSDRVAEAVGLSFTVDGVLITVLAEAPCDDDESFLVDLQAAHPATMFIRPALGFAFATPVTADLLHTRWVLQEIDGMDAGDAARASRLL